MVLEPFGIVLSKPGPALAPGEEFPFAAVMAEHGHLFNMVEGLLEAGASLKWVLRPRTGEYAGTLPPFPSGRAGALSGRGFGRPRNKTGGRSRHPGGTLRAGGTGDGCGERLFYR